MITDTPGSPDLVATSMTLSRQSFVILLYDVTNRASYQSLEAFVETFNHMNKNPHKTLIIVGNKANEGARTVLESEGREFAEGYQLDYYEISVKQGSNIDNIFFKSIQNVCKNIENKVWGENQDLDKYGIKILPNE